MLRLRRQHPRVEPAGRALLRDRVLRPAPWPPAACSSGTATTRRSTASPFLNRSISSEASAQYFLISGCCFLSSAIVAVELGRVQLVRILDPERRLRLRQVERRVGDLDRVVRDGDLALVLRAVDRRPARRRRLHLRRVVEQRVRAPLERDAVVLAVDRVVRRRLEGLDEVLPVRDSARRPPGRRRRRSAAGSRRPRPRPCRTGRRRPSASA